MRSLALHVGSAGAAFDGRGHFLNWPILKIVHLYDLSIRAGELFHRPLERFDGLAAGDFAAGCAGRGADLVAQLQDRVIALARFNASAIASTPLGFQQANGIKQHMSGQRAEPGAERAVPARLETADAQKRLGEGLLQHIVCRQDRLPAPWDRAVQLRSHVRTMPLQKCRQVPAVARDRSSFKIVFFGCHSAVSACEDCRSPTSRIIAATTCSQRRVRPTSDSGLDSSLA